MADSRYLIRPALESDMEWIEERIRSAGLDDEELYFHEFWVVEDEDKPVAFGRLKPYSDYFELADIFVEEEARYKGIGSFLVLNLATIEPEVPLYVTTRLPEFFERFGFAPVDEVPDKIASKLGHLRTSHGPDAVVMKLRRKVKGAVEQLSG